MRTNRHSLRYWSMLAIIAPWSVLLWVLSLCWFLGVLPEIGMSPQTARVSVFVASALFGLFCLWWAYFAVDCWGKAPGKVALLLFGLAVGVLASAVLAVLSWHSSDPMLSILVVVPIPFALSYAHSLSFGLGKNAV